jgi:hypothetical protein
VIDCAAALPAAMNMAAPIHAAHKLRVDREIDLLLKPVLL